MYNDSWSHGPSRHFSTLPADSVALAQHYGLILVILAEGLLFFKSVMGRVSHWQSITQMFAAAAAKKQSVMYVIGFLCHGSRLYLVNVVRQHVN